MTHTGFNNSLIIKRFAFEILNNFTHLAYIAFVRFEAKTLKNELIALYTIDEIRRIVTESIIPYLKKSAHQKKKTKGKEDFNQYIVEKLEEINLPEYDAFDDYLEMIIQFGYVTLFAASFPLAGLCSLIFNSLECVSDFFKLKTSFRRPVPLNADGIGSWKYVLNTMCYLCVITNIVLISFSSDQIAHIMPSFFKESAINPGNLLTAHTVKGKGKQAIGILFFIEHIMLIFIFLLRYFISSQPEWLSIYKDRKQYRRK